MTTVAFDEGASPKRSGTGRIMGFVVSVASVFAFVISGEGSVGGSVLTDGPKAVVSGTVVDLGEFPRGKSIVRTFRIENTGTTPLEIEARANCGCTLTNFDRKIAPGSAGKFEVELKSNTLLGEFRKTVDVTTNDSTLPKFKLEFKGKAIPAIEVSPSPVARVELKWDGPTEQEYRIKTAAGVSVLDAIASDRFVTSRLEPLETGNYRLFVRFAPETPAGSRSIVMTIATDAEFEKQIPLTITSDKGLVSTPEFLRFAPAFGQDGVAKAAVIVRSASGPVNILRAWSGDESLKVETKPIQEGRIHQVTVTGPAVKPEAKPDGNRKIVLETDDPHQPRFEIPIR